MNSISYYANRQKFQLADSISLLSFSEYPSLAPFFHNILDPGAYCLFVLASTNAVGDRVGIAAAETNDSPDPLHVAIALA